MRMNNQNTMNQNNADEPRMMKDTFSPEAMEMMRGLLDAIDEQRYYRREAEKQLKAQKGKVQFADAVAASDDSILVREMAVYLTQAGFSVNERQLYEWLRGNGYVYRQPCGKNIPTKKSLNLGVMELHKNHNTNIYGRTVVGRAAKITARGQQYFFDILMQEKQNAEKAAAEAAEKAIKAIMDKTWWEQRLTTRAEVEKFEALADNLMHTYRNKKATPYDCEKVFAYVHTLGITDDGEHYGIYSDKKADLLRHVFDQAAIRSDLNWQYIDRIYLNYEKHRVTSVEEAIEYEQRWKNGEIAV